MRTEITHDIIKEQDYYVALGRGNWFSWFIIPEYEEWSVCSIYGRFEKSFNSFGDAIKSLTEDI